MSEQVVPFVEPTPSDPSALPAASGVEPTSPEPAEPPVVTPEPVSEPSPAEEPAPQVEEPPSEVEEVEASSLSEVLEKLEIDQDWFNGLKVPVKVNGTVSEVPLNQVVDSFRTQEAAKQRLDEAKAKSEAAQAEIAAQSQALAEQSAIVSKVLASAEAQLKADTEGTDWAALRESDPAEYAARKEEIGQRRADLEAMKQGAAADWQKTVEEQRSQALHKLQTEILPQQAQLLAAAIPEWQDPAKQKTEQAELITYLGERFGYQPSELITDPNRPLEQPGVLDHRLIVMARESMLYRRAQNAADVKTKRVVKIPKTLKPASAKEAPAETPPQDDMVTRLYGKK